MKNFKTCPTCKLQLNRSDFPKNKARGDGMGSVCKACMRIYFKKRNEKIREFILSFSVKKNQQVSG